MPLDHFYKNRAGRYHCKEAQKEVARKQRRIPRSHAPTLAQKLVIEELLKNNIYATTGKCSEWKYIDVAVWGHIKIEVRASKFDEKDGSFNFKINEGKIENPFNSNHFVALVCFYSQEITFHIFPTTHPVFYVQKRTVKQGISYIPNAKYRKSENILTPELMEEHKDRWDLIKAKHRQMIGF
jgi:hypothetical protein